MGLATGPGDDSLVEAINDLQDTQQECPGNDTEVIQPKEGLDAKAWMEADDKSQPLPEEICPMVEVIRRLALKGSGIDGFAGLDVWSYGKPIRDLQGEDRFKMAELWEEMYGRDIKPLIENAYFALPILPQMRKFLSEQDLYRAERFINPALRISLLQEYFLVLTVQDGAVWDEFMLETFLRAWELMIAWYSHALADFLHYGQVVHSIDVSFSSEHYRCKRFPADGWKVNLKAARRLLNLAVLDTV